MEEKQKEGYIILIKEVYMNFLQIFIKNNRWLIEREMEKEIDRVLRKYEKKGITIKNIKTIKKENKQYSKISVGIKT